jgi:hypothetical protein
MKSNYFFQKTPLIMEEIIPWGEVETQDSCQAGQDFLQNRINILFK